jgi:hypothetical protein
MVNTKHAEIWSALAAEFAKSEVKSLTVGRRQALYITASTVMNRLDAVLGPEGWWDDFVPLEHSVICRLTVRLPDGTELTKTDAGGYSEMADQGDGEKSGYSDAFKRAAAKFGVGRYLKGDGAPNYQGEVRKPARASNMTGAQLLDRIRKRDQEDGLNREKQLQMWADGLGWDRDLAKWNNSRVGQAVEMLKVWKQQQEQAVDREI